MLGKSPRVTPRLSNERGKLHLEAQGLGWSVEEDRGERDSSSSFHESYEESFCENENEKRIKFYSRDPLYIVSEWSQI